MLTRRRFIRNVSLGAAGSTGFAGYGLAGALDLPGLRHVTLMLPQLPPEWDGVTIAQISDVHAGPYMPAERMMRVAEMVTSLDPDLVVFTGDQLDRRPSDAERFVRGFTGISAPLGVYGILGNHDHYFDPRLSEHALVEAGITPLVNQNRLLRRDGAEIELIGLEDLSAGPGRAPDFSLLGRSPAAFRICLSHQPRTWHDAAAAGAHLMLAGHTHGGQIAITKRGPIVEETPRSMFRAASASVRFRCVSAPRRKSICWCCGARQQRTASQPERAMRKPGSVRF